MVKGSDALNGRRGIGETGAVTDTRPLVLIVEDSISLATLYQHQLGQEKVRIRLAETLAEARRILAGEAPIAALIDLKLPDGDGTSLIADLKARAPDVAVVVMTAHGSINTAIEAMRAGAVDFLVKPFTEERLRTTMRNCLEQRRLARLVRTMSPSLGAENFEGFVGKDASMQAIYRVIEQAASSRASVFIQGESGTGKEVCAAAIHRRSARCDRPFVALNCAAIPHELIESEVFGHAKGAFTGAIGDREGAASRADGGTLFLDEICELDLSLQTKLLRFLQTGDIQKVGSDRMAKVDVRIVCATNRDPLAMVESGQFRSDLYYRLHVIPLLLPPLRERGEDALLIARHLLSQYAAEEGKGFQEFTPDAEDAILRYGWPGNVRELQNVMRQVAVLQSGQTVTIEMFPAALRRGPHAAEPAGAGRSGPRPASAKAAIRPLEVVEQEAIESAVRACGGNMTEAAALLGISVKTIYRKHGREA
jgi:DNA-binding NtrC family response regulator